MTTTPVRQRDNRDLDMWISPFMSGHTLLSQLIYLIDLKATQPWRDNLFKSFRELVKMESNHIAGLPLTTQNDWCSRINWHRFERRPDGVCDRKYQVCMMTSQNAVLLKSVKPIALNTSVVVLKVLISRNDIIGSALFSLDLIRARVRKGQLYVYTHIFILYIYIYIYIYIYCNWNISWLILFMIINQWCSNSSDYRQISNKRHTLIGNKSVDHFEVVGASPFGDNYVFILDLTYGFNGLGKNEFKTSRETVL